MSIYTIRLNDETVGEVNSLVPVEEGDRVTVVLHDENGLPIKKVGSVEEILDVKDY